MIDLNNWRFAPATDKGKVQRGPAKPSSPTVFISYNHGDTEIADKLKAALEKDGIHVRIDRAVMAAGENIQEFIETSIRETDVTVALVSNRSLLSAWVALESIETFYAEKSTNNVRKFIACYVDDNFFQPSFRLDATEQIDAEIARIDGLIPQYNAKKIDTNDLNNQKTRLYNLRNHLGDILQRLRGSLCLDIGERQFEKSMPKLVSAIRGPLSDRGDLAKQNLREKYPEATGETLRKIPAKKKDLETRTKGLELSSLQRVPGAVDFRQSHGRREVAKSLSENPDAYQAREPEEEKRESAVVVGPELLERLRSRQKQLGEYILAYISCQKYYPQVQQIYSDFDIAQKRGVTRDDWSRVRTFVNEISGVVDGLGSSFEEDTELRASLTSLQNIVENARNQCRLAVATNETTEVLAGHLADMQNPLENLTIRCPNKAYAKLGELRDVINEIQWQMDSLKKGARGQISDRTAEVGDKAKRWENH